MWLLVAKICLHFYHSQISRRIQKWLAVAFFSFLFPFVLEECIFVTILFSVSKLPILARFHKRLTPLWAFNVQATLSSSNFHFCFLNSNNQHFHFFIFDKYCFTIARPGPISQRLTPWRNGSASDSRSEGCVFESGRGQNLFPTIWLWHFCPKSMPPMRIELMTFGLQDQRSATEL